MSLALAPLAASAWDRGDVQRFATLPSGAGHPEGIAADKDGNIYTTIFDPTGAATNKHQMFVFDRQGRLVREVNIAGASHALLGLDFHPTTGALLVLDFGQGKVLKVDPVTGASTVFTTVTGASGLNALTFDQQGNVYISDSFQGIIWRTGPNGSPTATVWAQDPLLQPNGIPPFGANGLGFNKAFNTLFVANTANDSIIQIPVTPSATGPVAGPASALAYSVNGADGLILDADDNLWICANQSDEIVVLDKTGKVISKLGDFDGVDRDQAPIGLLFPASPVRVGDWIYITNLSLDLRNVGGPQTIDSQWADEVQTQTLARIRARIRPNRE
ncbi:MAG TPA: SMP-30/gluconolactonase/LRE family protein [Burkholderiales bacterium]